MSYLALYRKYRPYTFDDVVGQEHIIRTLKNQIKANRISHAYLFTGSRGTGKTSVAKILARAVNCEDPKEGSACGVCETCKKMNEGSLMNIIEIDAASHNGVDNIREINEEVKYTPAIGQYKVYIIDEVHMLSTGAFNALLKTLEEPPAHVIFILATTDPQKIPATILSRCQRFDFKRLTIDEIQERLALYMQKENIDVEKDALNYIARLADGGMRDALSILEQCISFYFDENISLDKVLYLMGAVDNTLLFNMMDALISFNSYEVIKLCDEVNRQGRNIRQFVKDLMVHARNLLVVTTTNQTEGVLDYSSEYITRLKEQTKKTNASLLMHYIKSFATLENDLKTTISPKILLEVGLLKLCEMPSEDKELQISDKLLQLERRIEELKVQRVTNVPNVAAVVPEKQLQEIVPTRPPKAVPEDIKRLRENWPDVLEQLSEGVKLVARSITPAFLEDDIFYLVCEPAMEPPIADKLDSIKEAINHIAEKEVKVKLITPASYENKYHEVYGTHPKKTKETVTIEQTINEIKDKINFNIDIR